MPYLNVLSNFRDNVRQFAKEKMTHNDFLALSDKLRDDDLVELGVLLDDQEGKALETRAKERGALPFLFSFAHSGILHFFPRWQGSR
jgi:hypothetical protein